MPLTSSNAARQLSDANSLGTILGQSATDKIGFYGVTTTVAQTITGGSLSSGALTSNVIYAINALGLVSVTTFGA